VLYFLSKLVLLVAQLAEELNLQDLLLDEAVNLHTVCDADATGGAVA
jgi:hypothetical protein